jgi:hypothetical protein
MKPIQPCDARPSYRHPPTDATRAGPVIRILLLLPVFASCGDPAYIACGKILCDPSQYCLQVYGGAGTDTGKPFNEPDCADAPDACGDRPDCDCLPDCTECTEADDGGAHCVINLP